jgi:rhamnose transport system permease protein
MSAAIIRVLRAYGRSWESVLLLLNVAAVVWAMQLSPFYWDGTQIITAMRFIAVPGLLALGLMVVVVVGEIDLSLPSIMAVCTVVLGDCSGAHVPLVVAALLALATGTSLGLLNGYVVSRFALPSLAVTLGTMGAYRGLAYVLGGEAGYSAFDSTYLWLGSASIFYPVSLEFLACACLMFAILMHASRYGRWFFAVGASITVARFSAIPASVVKGTAFGFGGFMSAIGALFYIGQYGSARADVANAMTLFLVTAVVLGGIDIYGGRGSVLGLALSLLLLGTLNNGMGLANIAGPTQTVVLGTLLIVTVLAVRILAIRRVQPPARPSPASASEGAVDRTVPSVGGDDLRR